MSSEPEVTNTQEVVNENVEETTGVVEVVEETTPIPEEINDELIEPVVEIIEETTSVEPVDESLVLAYSIINELTRLYSETGSGISLELQNKIRTFKTNVGL